MNSQTLSGRAVVSRPKVLLMILCGAVGAATAGAATADDVPRVVVKYDPGTLSDEAGARALYHRIVRAAAAVCPVENPQDLYQAELGRECREQSIARAVHQINSPRLAEVYSSHSKRA